MLQYNHHVCFSVWFPFSIANKQVPSKKTHPWSACNEESLKKGSYEVFPVTTCVPVCLAQKQAYSTGPRLFRQNSTRWPLAHIPCQLRRTYWMNGAICCHSPSRRLLRGFRTCACALLTRWFTSVPNPQREFMVQKKHGDRLHRGDLGSFAASRCNNLRFAHQHPITSRLCFLPVSL